MIQQEGEEENRPGDLDEPMADNGSDANAASGSDGENAAASDDGDDDNDVTYREITDGSQRGGHKLVDSRGHTYTVGQRGRNGVTWRCSVRRRSLLCKATVKQSSDAFEKGRHPHIHEPTPGEMHRILFRKDMKRLASRNMRKSGSEIAKDVLLTWGASEHGAKRDSMARMANRLRANKKPIKEPVELGFDLVEALVRDVAVPTSSMDLQRVVSILDDLAPPALAESWDNVGLLVEPSPPHPVSTMCLTNDLTEEVLSEAVSKKADFILSYHPPIFVAMKRLTMQNPKERIVIRALENRIAIYSPHTCYDVIEGGVNDWLIEGLGDVEQSRPLNASSDLKTPSGDDVRVSFTAPADSAADIMLRTQHPTEANFVSSTASIDGTLQISFTCKRLTLAEVMSSIREMRDVEQQSLQITELMKPPMLNAGAGRVATLKQPTKLLAMVKRIKTHLKLDYVQVAMGKGKTRDSLVSSVAVCAGSGASVLKNARADMFLTGEMSHHDILAAVAMGTSVVVCNHSNTERGFLHVLRKKLDEKFESSINIFVAETDTDPLQFI